MTNPITVYISQEGGEISDLQDLVDGNEVELEWVGSLEGEDIPIKIRLSENLGLRGVFVTRDQVEAWVGHTLTDEQIEELEEAVPNSSVPQAFEAIAHEGLGIPYSTDPNEQRS